MDIKKRIIKEYQDELDFVNRTISEIKRLILHYNDSSNIDTDNLILEIVKDDQDINTGIATSYQYNLEYFLGRKTKIEEYLKKLESL